jgi:hypothetical protein
MNTMGENVKAYSESVLTALNTPGNIAPIVSSGVDARGYITKIVDPSTGQETETGDPYYKDLGDYINKINGNVSITDETLKANATKIYTSISESVINKCAGPAFELYASGMTIWIPNHNEYYSYFSLYNTLDFAINSKWKDVLSAEGPYFQ